MAKKLPHSCEFAFLEIYNTLKLVLIPHFLEDYEYVFTEGTLEDRLGRDSEINGFKKFILGENGSWFIGNLEMNQLWIFSWSISRKHALVENWEWNNICSGVEGIEQLMFWHESDDELDGWIIVIVILKYGSIVACSNQGHNVLDGGRRYSGFGLFLWSTIFPHLYVSKNVWRTCIKCLSKMREEEEDHQFRIQKAWTFLGRKWGVFIPSDLKPKFKREKYFTAVKTFGFFLSKLTLNDIVLGGKYSH